jgi:hypothetical protein
MALLFGIFTVAFSPLMALTVGLGAGLIMLVIGLLLGAFAWILGVGRTRVRLVVGFTMFLFGFILLFSSLMISLDLSLGLDPGLLIGGLVIALVGILLVFVRGGPLPLLGPTSPRLAPASAPSSVVSPASASAAPPPGEGWEKYCSSCGTGNTKASVYCTGCGKALPPAC